MPQKPINRWSLAAVVASAGLAFSIVGFQITFSKRPIAQGRAFTVLDPQKWVGAVPVVQAFIDIRAKLGSGRWTVVLYRSDCDHCRKAIPKYEALAESTPVALIEMPPYASADQRIVSPTSHAALGKLSDSHEWFAQTPVRIELVDGKVISAAEGEAAENPE